MQFARPSTGYGRQARRVTDNRGPRNCPAPLREAVVWQPAALIAGLWTSADSLRTTFRRFMNRRPISYGLGEFTGRRINEAVNGFLAFPRVRAPECVFNKLF